MWLLLVPRGRKALGNRVAGSRQIVLKLCLARLRHSGGGPLHWNNRVEGAAPLARIHSSTGISVVIRNLVFHSRRRARRRSASDEVEGIEPIQATRIRIRSDPPLEFQIEVRELFPRANPSPVHVHASHRDESSIGDPPSGRQL